VYLRAVLLDAPNGNPMMYGYPAAACNAAVLGCSGIGICIPASYWIPGFRHSLSHSAIAWLT
jgi:hypothetical protein